MTLDLGALVGYVTLDTLQFDRAYPSVVRRLSQLGATAEGASAGTASLDRSLAGVAAASNGAATGLGRADRALTEAGVSASTATAATGAFADVTTEAGLAQSRLAQAVLRQTAAQERYNTLLMSGTASTRQLAAAEATLVAANDRVTLSQERLGKSTGLTSMAWQSAGRKMLLAGGVIALGFAYAGKQAADFDAKLANLRALAKGASGEELAALRDAALHVGQAYGYTAGEVADAETELVKAGVSVKNILGGALTGALTLAAAGQMDVAKATEIAAIAMTQFKLRGQDVPHIADLLAAGADKALGSVQDLGEALQYGGLSASQADQSLENTIGTLAEFAQAGLIGSSAGSALAMMLQNLQKPSDQAASLMKLYDISLYNANGTTKTFTQIAGELHGSLSKLPPAERAAALATIFTARARRAATILTVDGAKANREWTDSVNDQGFAALQAAGKLDSLSGDWQKFTAAMTSAVIGTGEGAQGPLRELVQDATAVVEAWTGLPAPVRVVAEALIGVAGAAALAGGAAIIMIPKFVAMNAVLEETSIGAITAGRAMGMMAKTTAIVAGLALAYEGIKFIHNATAETGPSVETFTADLIEMGNAGADASNGLLNAMSVIARLPFGVIGNFAKNLDTSFANLVTSGHADLAARDFARVSQTLHDAGMSTAEITRLFPGYSRVLAQSANDANLAADGTDSFGNAVTDAAKATQRATDAAKAYSDQLHALTDPLFAMNQAVQDLTDKQQAAAKALRKYGADSKQVRQANLDLAASALDVETASRTLAAGVKTGTVSLRDARPQLRAWVHDGLLTEGQAKAVTDSFGGLIDKANELHPALTRAGDATEKPRHQLDQLGGSAANLAHNLSGAGAAAAASFGFGFQSAWGSVISDIHNAIANLPKVHGSPSVNEMAPVLFIPAGEMLMAGLVKGIHNAAPDVVDATHQVFREIAKAVAPAVTDPTALATILAGRTTRAIGKTAAVPDARQAYRDARATYQGLHQDLRTLVADNKDLERLAHHNAAQAQRDADAAQHHADQISDKNKKAKAAAEDAARTAQRAADFAQAQADGLEHQDALAEKRAQRQVDRAKKVADAQKAAWDKATQAADKATQRAADAAQALLSSVTDAFDSMLAQFNDFQSTIAQGIVGDDSLATLWGQLVDAQTTATADLADAQQKVADAQDTLRQASGPDDVIPALQALADAQSVLAAAQAAYAQATAAMSASGLQSSLDTILTSAESFATDLQSLADAGASEDFLAQIAQMGYGAGDALAQALLAAGPDAITSLQTSMAAIQAVADSEGDLLAQHFYGGGLTAMEQFIKGLMDKFPELRGALQGMVSQIDSILGVVAPSGSVGATDLVLGRINPPTGLAPPPLVIPALSMAGAIARGGDGATLGGVVSQLAQSNDRLGRIEQHLAVAPERLGAVTIDGFKSAGQESARQLVRDRRGR